MSKLRYSIVIPVYNRPQELHELLESLCTQTVKNFEVIIVEDGSTINSQKVYEAFADKLTLRYFYKPNTGPGPSRNFGFEKANGDFFVVFDSDCILPANYFEVVEQFLSREKIDAWGGPDSGMKDFTALQQAMAYTMSSYLTTGGIRGKAKKDFQPRSFNMGMSRKVFEKTRGFQFDRYAEDIELSIRIRKAGFVTRLIPEAFVYHKRRATLKDFFKQVSNFGKGRVLVGRAHPGEIKLTHWFPFLFLAGLVASLTMAVVFPVLSLIAISCYILYTFAIFFAGWWSTKSLKVALLCIPSVYVQLLGYGWGFIKTIAG